MITAILEIHWKTITDFLQKLSSENVGIIIRKGVHRKKPVLDKLSGYSSRNFIDNLIIRC